MIIGDTRRASPLSLVVRWRRATGWRNSRPVHIAGTKSRNGPANVSQCGSPLGHKTAKEAYISWSGLGLFDLIPGIRDLPYPVRFVIMVVVVLLVVVVVPLVLLVAVPLVNKQRRKGTALGPASRDISFLANARCTASAATDKSPSSTSNRSRRSSP